MQNIILSQEEINSQNTATPTAEKKMVDQMPTAMTESQAPPTTTSSTSETFPSTISNESILIQENDSSAPTDVTLQALLASTTAYISNITHHLSLLTTTISSNQILKQDNLALRSELRDLKKSKELQEERMKKIVEDKEVYEELEMGCFALELKVERLEKEKEELMGRVKMYFDAYGGVEDI